MILVISVAILEVFYNSKTANPKEKKYNEKFRIRNLMIGLSIFTIVWFVLGLFVIFECNRICKQ